MSIKCIAGDVLLPSCVSLPVPRLKSRLAVEEWIIELLLLVLWCRDNFSGVATAIVTILYIHAIC